MAPIEESAILAYEAIHRLIIGLFLTNHNEKVGGVGTKFETPDCSLCSSISDNAGRQPAEAKIWQEIGKAETPASANGEKDRLKTQYVIFPGPTLRRTDPAIILPSRKRIGLKLPVKSKFPNAYTLAANSAPLGCEWLGRQRSLSTKAQLPAHRAKTREPRHPLSGNQPRQIVS
jgi:hypothetical protein